MHIDFKNFKHILRYPDTTPKNTTNPSTNIRNTYSRSTLSSPNLSVAPFVPANAAPTTTVYHHQPPQSTITDNHRRLHSTIYDIAAFLSHSWDQDPTKAIRFSDDIRKPHLKSSRLWSQPGKRVPPSHHHLRLPTFT